jgi:hypothetical protein
MQTYRDRLIRQGIWNPEDPRDPATDEEASRELEEWIKSQLAPLVAFQIVVAGGAIGIISNLLTQASQAKRERKSIASAFAGEINALLHIVRNVLGRAEGVDVMIRKT